MLSVQRIHQPQWMTGWSYCGATCIQAACVIFSTLLVAWHSWAKLDCRERSWKIMKYKFPDINLDTCCQAKSINRIQPVGIMMIPTSLIHLSLNRIQYLSVPKCPISLTLSTRLPAPPNSSATSDQRHECREDKDPMDIQDSRPIQMFDAASCMTWYYIFFEDAPWLQSLPGLLRNSNAAIGSMGLWPKMASSNVAVSGPAGISSRNSWTSFAGSCETL